MFRIVELTQLTTIIREVARYGISFRKMTKRNFKILLRGKVE